jgi:hypothetical protein
MRVIEVVSLSSNDSVNGRQGDSSLDAARRRALEFPRMAELVQHRSSREPRPRRGTFGQQGGLPPASAPRSLCVSCEP